MDKVFKVIVTGPYSAGKSCLLLRFTDDAFFESHIATIGVDFKIKSLCVAHPMTGQMMDTRLQIWDTAGQDRFRTITTTFYRGAHAVVVVFDATDLLSFETALSDHLQDAKRHITAGTPIFLVGNKCDHQGIIAEDVIKNTATSHGLQGYYMVSAKTGHNVDHLFSSVTNTLLETSLKSSLLFKDNEEKHWAQKSKTIPITQHHAERRKPTSCADCTIL